jgi:hypothetical protein
MLRSKKNKPYLHRNRSKKCWQAVEADADGNRMHASPSSFASFSMSAAASAKTANKVTSAEKESLPFDMGEEEDKVSCHGDCENNDDLSHDEDFGEQED